jgi:hypothetical protein
MAEVFRRRRGKRGIGRWCSGGAQGRCEVRIGRTPGPSDVAGERRRPRGVQWGHDLSMGRTLEKLAPKR